MHPLFDIVLRDIRVDAQQMVEEGHDLAQLEKEIEAAAASKSLDTLAALQEDFWSRPSPPGLPYHEPDDWESIARHFPDAQSHARFEGSDELLADRIHGGWLGRCVGCQSGKPLEGMLSPDVIQKVLHDVGSWPLHDYMNPLPEGYSLPMKEDGAFYLQRGLNDSCKGNFHYMQPDDDIHYALLSQKLLQDFGTDFTTQNVIDTIAHHTPGAMIFAAGRNMWRTGLMGFAPPYTALYGNPCRQSLGAMIRCDAFGWAAPAHPALAARMAYKDATASQRRNGIYSGIFFAVLIADTLAHGDPVQAIDTAAAYVPPRSRFAEMIGFVRNACQTHTDWEPVCRAIIAKWPAEFASFNHAIPNAAIVLLGLLKGQRDFTDTLGITVMAGGDSDCTGATVGSIMGCALGARGIPQHWAQPLHDTIHTTLAWMHEQRISDVANEMFSIARTNVRRTDGQ